MHSFKVRNVNAALSEAMWYLYVQGVRETSRNGEVLVAPEPVCTTYERPQERVLFSRIRDANPYFHLMEALWMLGGRQDVAFPAQFNGRIGQYSDDGVIFHGAYGYRWRHHFGTDQLADIVKELSERPDSRRAVLTLWDAGADLGRSGVDVPCNTQAYFDLREGRLNAAVCNRSNDAIWGCYGANAVQFSMLQEYLASWLGVPVGLYRQMSNNLHVYRDVPRFDQLVPFVDVNDLYTTSGVAIFPLMREEVRGWDEDLTRFLSDPTGDATYHDPFFNDVAAPMASSWFDRKSKRSTGEAAALAIGADDWRTACVEWIHRREEALHEHG